MIICEHKLCMSVPSLIWIFSDADLSSPFYVSFSLFGFSAFLEQFFFVHRQMYHWLRHHILLSPFYNKKERLIVLYERDRQASECLFTFRTSLLTVAQVSRAMTMFDVLCLVLHTIIDRYNVIDLETLIIYNSFFSSY